VGGGGEWWEEKEQNDCAHYEWSVRSGEDRKKVRGRK